MGFHVSLGECRVSDLLLKVWEGNLVHVRLSQQTRTLRVSVDYCGLRESLSKMPMYGTEALLAESLISSKISALSYRAAAKPESSA